MNNLTYTSETVPLNVAQKLQTKLLKQKGVNWFDEDEVSWADLQTVLPRAWDNSTKRVNFHLSQKGILVRLTRLGLLLSREVRKQTKYSNGRVKVTEYMVFINKEEIADRADVLSELL